MKNKALVEHKRYGKAYVVNVWRKLINPDTRQTKLDALTLELLTEEGKRLHNLDRSYRNCASLGKRLPFCYENNLSLITLVE